MRRDRASRRSKRKTSLQRNVIPSLSWRQRRCPAALVAFELRTSLESANRPGQARASKPQGGWEPSKLRSFILLQRLAVTLPIYKKSFKRKGMVEKIVMQSDLLGAQRKKRNEKQHSLIWLPEHSDALAYIVSTCQYMPEE